MIDKPKTWRVNVVAKVFQALVGCGLVAVPAAAHAAIIVTANSSNTIYGAGFLGVPAINNGLSADIVNSAFVAGFPAEYGLKFATASSNDSFSFLQNQYCVGRCTTYALTTVTLTLTNTGSDAETMRFDSEITPGHLASVGFNPNAKATFNFGVTETTANVTRTLYSASGLADANATEITTSDGQPFNGLTRSTDGETYDALDWSATNLNLLLDTLLPGQTSTLVYSALTLTTAATSQCRSITNCAGVQVVFGDPRRNGGGSNGVLSLAAFAEPVVPVIGVQYGPSVIGFDIVSPDTPLPPEPPVLPTPNYGPLFISQASSPTPEPASWMLMIAGFGLIGAALRRYPMARRARPLALRD